MQFTPDLLPSDVVGVTVWNRGTSEFEFRPGPIFANIVLGDEINRASPKTQSALLEAMEERQVTVDGTTYPLGSPFMVIATQNPIEHEGTYPLPESQLDRFLMRVSVGYPDRDGRARDPRHPRRRTTPSKTSGRWSTAADVRAMMQRGATRPRRAEPEGVPRRPRGGDASPSRGSRSACRRGPRSACSASPGRAPRRSGRNYVRARRRQGARRAGARPPPAVTPEAQLQGIDAATVVADVLGSVPVPIRTTRESAHVAGARLTRC